MREAKRAALFVPTIFEGIAQPARADASHASGQRCKSFCPHHFCPCGVVQPTCLPLMQEITGAKPVRDANFTARGSRGIADPPDSESGSLGRASRLAPTIFKAPKALSVMRSLGRRANSVQLRVGDPFRNRASAQAGFISQLRPGQHSGLRPHFTLSRLRSITPRRSGLLNRRTRAVPSDPPFLSPPCSSPQVFFVRKSCRGSTGGRLHALLLL